MKVRLDYVSNSSSSSYIVISKTGKRDNTETIRSAYAKYDHTWCSYDIPNDLAKHEFGWEFENTASFAGKMNFIGIQLCELLAMRINGAESKYDFDKCYTMLRKVCREKFGFEVGLAGKLLYVQLWDSDEVDKAPRIHVMLDDNYYIDHQSCVTEGECMDMFSSEDALYDFLRFDESYIRGGNDNG